MDRPAAGHTRARRAAPPASGTPRGRRGWEWKTRRRARPRRGEPRSAASRTRVQNSGRRADQEGGAAQRRAPAPNSMTQELPVHVKEIRDRKRGQDGGGGEGGREPVAMDDPAADDGPGADAGIERGQDAA